MAQKFEYRTIERCRVVHHNNTQANLLPRLHEVKKLQTKVRIRYWSHSFLKWPRLYHAAPNINHRMLAEWETSDRFLWLITQNVDGLHVKAGSNKVTELHGNARYGKCTDCDYTESRQTFQEKLDRVNPGFADRFVIPGYIPTDGNIHLPLETEKNFNIPGCPCCGGIMLTAVTLFGDKIPNYKLEHSQQKVKECDGILTLGTSLEVYSGYQYVLQANQQNKPIFIVNIGSTRADGIATMKLDYKISDVLREM
ncbi:hypothetical protein CRE_19118 [Caenorhabditis remanei]|uniref:Deacetylase sirtuin-type domain-containing protein n=1 Tax=Caenorhabditis remanei TaxID=31234 RepID=E3MJE6_CAERE|nr:hypothetical protein CRE_19118 [Caenorhabditis remanei]